MAFFERWWSEQNVQVQQKVRHLVHEGRLQFAGGGWTQNDEATTHYLAIIDNLSLGWKFIQENFGSLIAPPNLILIALFKFVRLISLLLSNSYHTFDYFGIKLLSNNYGFYLTFGMVLCYSYRTFYIVC